VYFFLNNSVFKTFQCLKAWGMCRVPPTAAALWCRAQTDSSCSIQLQNMKQFTGRQQAAHLILFDFIVLLIFGEEYKLWIFSLIKNSRLENIKTDSSYWFLDSRLFKTMYQGDFRFSRRRVWRWLSSGLLRRVVWQKLTDVSEVLVEVYRRFRGSNHIWNVGKPLPDYTAEQPRRQSSSHCINFRDYITELYRVGHEDVTYFTYYAYGKPLHPRAPLCTTQNAMYV
jgi:hypothetical protein